MGFNIYLIWFGGMCYSLFPLWYHLFSRCECACCTHMSTRSGTCSCIDLSEIQLLPQSEWFLLDFLPFCLLQRVLLKCSLLLKFKS